VNFKSYQYVNDRSGGIVDCQDEGSSTSNEH
jgi:hypothetical protein